MLPSHAAELKFEVFRRVYNELQYAQSLHIIPMLEEHGLDLDYYDALDPIRRTFPHASTVLTWSVIN